METLITWSFTAVYIAVAFGFASMIGTLFTPKD